MKNNKEPDYFDLFIKAASISDRAANSLAELMDNIDDAKEKSEAIHVIEHEGDDLIHEVFFQLNRSFITPIEREDIIEISSRIEDTIDSIDEVSLMFDMLCAKKAKKGAKEMCMLINRATTALVAATVEFKNFKKSKNLSKLIVDINHIEEEGDTLFHNLMKKLFSEEKDILEIVRWQSIYQALEDTLDSVENVADAMERVIIKNC